MDFEPLEIKTAIKNELDLQIRLGSEGRSFPHPGIEVQLYTPDEEYKNVYLGTFGENKLQSDIREHLEAKCDLGSLFVELSFVENTEDETFVESGFQLRYISEQPQTENDVYLEVLEGVANRKQMKLVNSETFIGRCQKVINRYGGIERINDLYFSDTREVKGKISKNLKKAEKINNSVSRLHAHIKCVGGIYFLFDDKSSRGTSVLPEGRGQIEQIDSIAGKKLGNNDVISFGKAVVKVRIVEKKN